ncbi:MAG: hypothetical protein ACM3ON_04830, partial [Chloroflexota bacterium]
MKTDTIMSKISAQGHRRRAFRCQSPDALSSPPGRLSIIISCLIAMAVAAGCASTNITSRQEVVTGQLPRPAHIWVYDFAATPADVPADSWLADQYIGHDTPQTPEQIATGRQLGAEIAAQLVQEILD